MLYAFHINILYSPNFERALELFLLHFEHFKIRKNVKCHLNCKSKSQIKV